MYCSVSAEMNVPPSESAGCVSRKITSLSELHVLAVMKGNAKLKIDGFPLTV